jgi:hypothetical protein
MASDPDPAGSASEIVALYSAAWHEPDEGARREMLERCWAQDGVYVDPTVVVRGREELVAHLGGFEERMPGCSIVVTTGVNEHHGRVRFGWHLLNPDGTLMIEGQDFGELDDDGRLRRIVGFFGPPAPA